MSSPIKFVLAPKKGRALEVSTTPSYSYIRGNRSMLSRHSNTQNALPKRYKTNNSNKTKKRHAIKFKERLEPKSTWSLLPRHARKFLTTREKQVVPTTFAMKLKNNLLQSFIDVCKNLETNGSIISTTPAIDKGENIQENIYSSLRKHPFMFATSKQLWYMLVHTGENKICFKQFATLCHKIVLLVTGISNNNEDPNHNNDNGTRHECSFDQFRTVILSVINECSPLYRRSVDYVEWTSRLMDLLTYDAGDATILFRHDEEILGSTLIPKTPWSNLSESEGSLFDDTGTELKDLVESDNDSSAELGLLPRARLGYRGKITEAFSQYPYKAGENPAIRWQPMRTWQLREMKLAKRRREFQKQQLLNNVHSISTLDADENQSRANSAVPSQSEIYNSSSHENYNSGDTNVNDSEQSNSFEAMSITGSKKSMINWKYKVVTLKSKEDKNKQKKRIKTSPGPQYNTQSPSKNNDTSNLTTYTEFQNFSRLSMSHYRMLADGTKLASKHNDISFNKEMKEKMLNKKDYIYTTNLEPLPDGHSIVEEFALYTEPMESTNDLRHHTPLRNYKLSQLGHISCLKLGTPLPLVAFPYKRNKKRVRKKQERDQSSIHHKYVFNKNNPWSYDASKHQVSTSNSGSICKQNSESSETLSREYDYIQTALECAARAKIRKQQILDEKNAAMY